MRLRALFSVKRTPLKQVFKTTAFRADIAAISGLPGAAKNPAGGASGAGRRECGIAVASELQFNVEHGIGHRAVEFHRDATIKGAHDARGRGAEKDFVALLEAALDRDSRAGA